MTQRELANKLGVHRNSISDWERAQYLPDTREMVLDLAGALGLYQADTDRLLRAAQFSLEYHTTEAELSLVTHFEEARVERMVVARLEVASPPARPAVPLRTRVPDARAARLVGRQEDLRWVCRRLKAGDTAAIAGVRGIGGIGKTELAIAAARELEAHFEGRVIWLDCGPNDVFALQERLAAAVGVSLEGDDLQVRADVLALAFRQQPPTLVILDDLRRRHLADFAFIAPPRPPCALLITSRRDDLPLSRQAIRRLDVLDPGQSQALLSALLPGEWLSAEPDAAERVAELLERVPLALTLAARRAERIARRRSESARRPLAALLDELLEWRIQVLNQGEDPERPDLSVVITFNASYDDLDPADQARLCRLGVFARNQFDLEALVAVWGDGKPAACQALERLANAGLLEEAEQDTWWMHDLLREYAAGCLEKLGVTEGQAARLAHAAYWQQYLDDLELLGVADWQNLEMHRPEVTQAAGWLLNDWERAPELAAELAVAISQTFEWYALAQWEAWVRTGLLAAEAREKRNLARRLERSLGGFLWQRGEAAQAGQFLQTSLATARELLEAATTGEEIEAGQRGVAVTLGDIARLKAQAGDVAGALALHQEEMAVYEQLGDVRSRAVTQCDLADLRHAQGEDEEAERLYRDSLEISRRIGDAEGTYTLLARLGQLALGQGRPEEALPLLQQARQGFQDMGFVPWVAHLDDLLARAQGRVLILDDLLAMIRAARQGDQQAGEQAWESCQDLIRAQDASLAALGRALQRVLSGIPPETALADLPDDLRAPILEAL